MAQEVPENIRFETFEASLEESGAPEARTLAWYEADAFGFHEERLEPARLAELVGVHCRDGRTLTGAYDDGLPDYAWDPAVPVATYGTMVNDLNVGGGKLLPTHLVTGVTVRPTHRRRGILRSMITADLQRAKAQGLALAALTASEATIYGRFGFGTATSTALIEVDVRNRLDFRKVPAGSVSVADPAKIQELSPQIYRVHLERTFGALGRQHSYPKRASGAWGASAPEPDRGVRTVLHYDPAGTPDGYATYKSMGWGTEPHTMKVIDLVAASDEAYLGLWHYLGSIDLVERLTFDAAPLEDPLPWALADRRRYKVTGVDDVLWLRILDTPAALAARGYFGDGALELSVTDPMGLAGGTWRLEVTEGNASVAPAAAGGSGLPRAEISIDALGSLYLGGVTAPTLAASGSLSGDSDALAVLDRMFAAGPAPYCSTQF